MGGGASLKEVGHTGYVLGATSCPGPFLNCFPLSAPAHREENFCHILPTHGAKEWCIELSETVNSDKQFLPLSCFFLGICYSSKRKSTNTKMKREKQKLSEALGESGRSSQGLWGTAATLQLHSEAVVCMY